MRHHFYAAAAAAIAALSLSACDNSDNFDEALVIMLQCRSRFDVAISTLSQSSRYLSAQEKLNVFGKATVERMRCEEGINPYLSAAGMPVPR
jgi:hypothetical protein